MNLYRFSEMIVRTFMGLGGAKILKLHQASNGWVLIVRDEIDGQEYIGTFYPATSTKFVCPESADKLLAMTKKVSND